MSLSLTGRNFLTRSKARSLESLNSALQPQTVKIRPYGDAPFAKTGDPKKFRNVRSRDILPHNLAFLKILSPKDFAAFRDYLNFPWQR
jgi:hypothetical protein